MWGSMFTMQPAEMLTLLACQAVFFGLLAIACSWAAWVWTHEEIFADIQNVLKAGIAKHEPLMHKCWDTRRYRPMVYHWAIQKACKGLSCYTCCGHYPAIVFIYTGGYVMLDVGWKGTLIAWFYTAFIADGICQRIERARIAKKEEKAGEKKAEAEAEMVEADAEDFETAGFR